MHGWILEGGGGDWSKWSKVCMKVIYEIKGLFGSDQAGADETQV